MLTRPTVMVVRYHLTVMLDQNIQIASVYLHDPSPPLEWMDLPVCTILTRAMAPELLICQKGTMVEVLGPQLGNLQDTQAHENAQDNLTFSVDMELLENENGQAR